MINRLNKSRRRFKPYRKKIKVDQDVYDFRYADALADALFPLLEMRSRYQYWIRNLKMSESRNNFLMYMRFSGYPFCQYMPYFDFTNGILHFINKPLWEYHKWQNDFLHNRFTLVLVADIKEFRFINTVICQGNVLNNSNIYYSTILDNNYINFLQKYNIINAKKKYNYIECWMGSRPWKGGCRIQNFKNSFICTDQKIIEKKIIKVGEIHLA